MLFGVLQGPFMLCRRPMRAMHCYNNFLTIDKININEILLLNRQTKMFILFIKNLSANDIGKIARNYALLDIPPIYTYICMQVAI